MKKDETFSEKMLKMDVHIGEIHNIEQYDQLVEICHDMQLMHMFQKLFDFFHPNFCFKSLILKVNEEKKYLQHNEV